MGKPRSGGTKQPFKHNNFIFPIPPKYKLCPLGPCHRNEFKRLESKAGGRVTGGEKKRKSNIGTADLCTTPISRQSENAKHDKHTLSHMLLEPPPESPQR